MVVKIDADGDNGEAGKSLFIGRDKEINEQTQITLKHCLEDRVFVDKDNLVYYRGLFLILLSAFPYFLLPDLCVL